MIIPPAKRYASVTSVCITGTLLISMSEELAVAKSIGVSEMKKLAR
jgi:hypothetical protein